MVMASLLGVDNLAIFHVITSQLM